MPATNAVSQVDSVPDVDETSATTPLDTSSGSRPVAPDSFAPDWGWTEARWRDARVGPAVRPLRARLGRLRQRGPLFRSRTDERSPMVASTTTLNERTPGVTDHVSLRCLLAWLVSFTRSRRPSISLVHFERPFLSYWRKVLSQSDSAMSAATPVSSALSSPCALVGTDNSGFGNHASGRRSR